MVNDRIFFLMAVEAGVIPFKMVDGWLADGSGMDGNEQNPSLFHWARSAVSFLCSIWVGNICILSAVSLRFAVIPHLITPFAGACRCRLAHRNLISCHFRI